MSTFVRMTCLLAVLALAGCATLSRSECQTGDWYSIGERDGANGYTEDRFLNDAKACAARGMPADRDRWMEGRDRGLARYCTARHAIEVGSASDSYQGVCAGPAEGDFLLGYRLGRSLADARERRAHWNRDIQQIRHRLDEADRDRGVKSGDDKSTEHHALTDAERVELGYRLGIATVRHDEAERDLAAIEERSGQL